MKKDDIKLSDIQRILLGDAPASFLLEVFFRTIIAYVVMIIIVRLLGKRMSSKMTPTEMAVLLMFGAIVSGIMQIPDRGVLEGSFVLVVVLIIQRLLTLYSVKNKKAEDILFGKMEILIKEGVLQVEKLAAETISRHQLFALLRSKGYEHLGEIKRLYMETSGNFSFFKAKEPLPGLSVFPEDDSALMQGQQKDDTMSVCLTCGKRFETKKLPAQCDHCNSKAFTKAVKKKS